MGGQSAGASSVTYHLVTPRSFGLYDRVISSSPVVGLSNPNTVQTGAAGVTNSRNFVIAAGCNKTAEQTDQETLDCLLSLTPAQILATGIQPGPSIDPTYELIDRDPLTLISQVCPNLCIKSYSTNFFK